MAVLDESFPNTEAEDTTTIPPLPNWNRHWEGRHSSDEGDMDKRSNADKSEDTTPHYTTEAEGEDVWQSIVSGIKTPNLSSISVTNWNPKLHCSSSNRFLVQCICVCVIYSKSTSSTADWSGNRESGDCWMDCSSRSNFYNTLDCTHPLCYREEVSTAPLL